MSPSRGQGPRGNGSQDGGSPRGQSPRENKPRRRRLFIALSLPDSVRRFLAEEGRALPGEFFRPIKEENLHLTLAFLGDSPDSVLDELKQLMGDAADALLRRLPGPLVAEVGGPGAFPHAGSPRVVWMGLARGAREAGELAAALRRGLRRAGIPFDGKPFAAHITLAYARRNLSSRGLDEAGKAFGDYLRRRGTELLRGTEDRSQDHSRGGGQSTREPLAPRNSPETFVFPGMLLLESRPHPGGSVFSPLHRVRL